MKRWFQSKTFNTPSPAGMVLSYLMLGIWALLNLVSALLVSGNFFQAIRSSGRGTILSPIH